jgi:hypothetical protein
MVFNTTFNNISVISWRSVLLVKETRVTAESHKTLTLSHNVIVGKSPLNRILTHNVSGDRH